MATNIRQYIPPPRLFTLGIATSILSLFHTGYQYAVTGLPSAVLKEFIRGSHAWQIGEAKPALVSDNIVNIIWGLVTAGLPLSIFFGCIFAPPLADNLGRKPVLFLVNNIIVITGSLMVLISSWTKLWEILLIGRIIFGIQIGIAVTVVPAYLTECSPIKYRGFMGSLHGPCTYFGALVAQVLSISSLLGTKALWPVLLAAGTIPAALQMILYFVVPETPQYEYIQNKNGSVALATIQKFFGQEGATPELVEATLLEYQKQKQGSENALGIWQVLKTRNLWPTICLVVAVGVARSATGEYTLLVYTSDTLLAAGVPANYIEPIGIMMQISVMTVAAVGCILVESFGRRPLMLSTLVYCAVAWLIVLIMLVVQGYATSGAVWTVWISLVLMLSIYGLAYPCGCSTISWFISAELTNQPERTSISALCMMADAIMAFIITLLYPIVSAWSHQFAIVMFFIVPLIGIITFLYKRLPETKNKPIHEIVTEIGNRAGRSPPELEQLLLRTSSAESMATSRRQSRTPSRTTYGSQIE